MAYIGNQPVPQATQTRDSFTATASQTTFTTSQGYSVGFIDVFMNGIRLTGSDFTATDGSTVVLASGATSGDLIDIIAYSTFTPFVGAIDGIPIGGTTPAAGSFTTLDTTGNLTVTGGMSATDDSSWGVPQTIFIGNGAEWVFHHPSSDSTRNIIVHLQTDDSVQPPRYRFCKNRGGPYSHQTVLDGDSLGEVQFYGDDGTNVVFAGMIDVSVSGTPSTGVVPTKMILQTATTAGAVVTGIEIDNAQNVAISNGNLTVTGQYIEEYAATGTSGAVTINLNTGNNFSTAMAGAVTYTFSNAATSGTVSSFTLKVVNNGSAITWPASVDWPAATAPTLSASGATDVFVFYTHDGGTTWYGFTAGQAMA